MSPPPLVSEEDARKRTGSRLTSVIRPGSPTSAHQVLLSSVLGPPGAPTVLTGAKGSEAARKSLDGSDFEVVIPHQDPRLSSAAVSGTGPSCPAPRALRPLQAPPTPALRPSRQLRTHQSGRQKPESGGSAAGRLAVGLRTSDPRDWAPASPQAARRDRTPRFLGPLQVHPMLPRFPHNPL